MNIAKQQLYDSQVLHRLLNEIELLVELKICYKLGDSETSEYIFPSLGIESIYSSISLLYY